MDTGLRTTVRCIISAYQDGGIEAQADAMTGFIENLLRSRDEINAKFQEESNEMWQKRVDFEERLRKLTHGLYGNIVTSFPEKEKP